MDSTVLLIAGEWAHDRCAEASGDSKNVQRVQVICAAHGICRGTCRVRSRRKVTGVFEGMWDEKGTADFPRLSSTSSFIFKTSCSAMLEL